MASQTTITLIDDLDGKKAAETLSFGLDGASYEINLRKQNAAALRKALGEFLDFARAVRLSAPIKPGDTCSPPYTGCRHGRSRRRARGHSCLGAGRGN